MQLAVCVRVVSAVDDGNCSPWVTCNSSVVQESIRWKVVTESAVGHSDILSP